MFAKVALFILGIVGSFSSCSALFYLYDRVNNRPVSYRFTDAGDIYYTSQNFHSIDYVRTNNTGNATTHSVANKINRSVSLPNMRLL